MSEEPKPAPAWVAMVAPVLAALVSLAGLFREREAKPKPGTAAGVAPWIGAGLTVVAAILHATWQASKADSINMAQSAEIAAMKVEMRDRDGRAEAELREQERITEYLCNERRRDNQERGRPANGAPC